MKKAVLVILLLGRAIPYLLGLASVFFSLAGRYEVATYQLATACFLLLINMRIDDE